MTIIASQPRLLFVIFFVILLSLFRAPSAPGEKYQARSQGDRRLTKRKGINAPGDSDAEEQLGVGGIGPEIGSGLGLHGVADGAQLLHDREHGLAEIGGVGEVVAGVVVRPDDGVLQLGGH